MDQTSLKALALAFRRGFETTDLSNAPGNLPTFPKGCCNWASYMVGHFLMYEQFLDPVEIVGERLAPDGTEQHSWLRLNNLIIDITSDQFPDGNGPVIVSTPPAWYDVWEVVEENEILEISCYDDVPYAGQPMRPSDVYELVVVDVRLRVPTIKAVSPK